MGQHDYGQRRQGRGDSQKTAESRQIGPGGYEDGASQGRIQIEPSESEGYRVCDRPEDFAALSNYTTTQSAMDLLTLVQETDCELSCKREEYVIHHVSDDAVPCDASVDCRHLVQLMVVMKDSDVLVEEEKWLYESSDFIGDVGGYMGLLLGASIISVYVFVVECAKGWAAACKRGRSAKRRKKKKEKTRPVDEEALA